VIVDLGCILMAAVASFFCWLNRKLLQGKYDTMVEEQNKKILPNAPIP